MTSKETSTLPLPPGSLGLPLLGETISFFTDRNFNSSRQAKYGKVYLFVSGRTLCSVER